MVGPLPTPAIAFLTRSLRADAGVMISASHNPYQDNGIKFFSNDGLKLPDEMEARIEELIVSNEIAHLRPTADAIGKAYRIDDAAGRYIEFVKRRFPRSDFQGINWSLTGERGGDACADRCRERAPKSKARHKQDGRISRRFWGSNKSCCGRRDRAGANIGMRSTVMPTRNFVLTREGDRRRHSWRRWVDLHNTVVCQDNRGGDGMSNLVGSALLRQESIWSGRRSVIATLSSGGWPKDITSSPSNPVIYLHGPHTTGDGLISAIKSCLDEEGRINPVRLAKS